MATWRASVQLIQSTQLTCEVPGDEKGDLGRLDAYALEPNMQLQRLFLTYSRSIDAD